MLSSLTGHLPDTGCLPPPDYALLHTQDASATSLPTEGCYTQPRGLEPPFKATAEQGSDDIWKSGLRA